MPAQSHAHCARNAWQHCWPLCRFSQYPQDLTLRLEAPARLAQIQLLSHEFKIAAKVELLVGAFDSAGAAATAAGMAVTGTPPPPAAADPAKASWRRLGFLSFDANDKSSYSARELKSVALSGTAAHLLRLVFHRCHANAANIYGQARGSMLPESWVALQMQPEHGGARKRWCTWTFLPHSLALCLLWPCRSAWWP